MRMRWLVFFFVGLSLLSATIGAETLVGKNSTWSYLDNGTNQGTAWQSIGFNDSIWKIGAAELGYGDGDESTVVSYGPNASSKFITTYFRRHFTVANPGLYSSLTLNVKRDDGAVIYLNGVEVRRENMPAGSISYTTTTSNTTSETTYFSSTIPPSALLAGDNVLAVEVHQTNATSSDLSFDLELIGNLTGVPTVSVVRGPYLQMATPTSMTVRWRTDVATDSRVRFGIAQGSLNLVADDPALTTEHQVKLTGLTTETRYWYSVGSSAAAFSGGDSTTFFNTGPVNGTARPTRIWVIGDAGTGNSDQTAVYNAYRNTTGSLYTHLWLMLGDNAYNSGTDAEFQTNVFNIYPEIFKQSPVWPTIGNHDAASADSATQSGPYYDIFTLPRNGEAGGVASGTEAYYSYDYGNIHFIVLDSQETSRSGTGPMMTWLTADLQATNADWVIAYWHHPPYTKGSHNSDTETQLIDMRQVFVPVLEQNGVDLVLTGHSHSYERSKFIDGHYGNSTTFSDSLHVIQAGSGRADGSGAYAKASGGVPHDGAVYAVAGSSGQISGGTLNHPAMVLSLNELGSMILDIDGLTLNAKFINNNGTVRDYFTITKDSAPPPPAACAVPWGGTIMSGQSVTAYLESVSSNCVAETRLCSNGVLSGSYTFQSCSTPQPASCTLPWGGTIAHGQSVTAYQTSISSSCTSETRICNNGTLTGSFAFPACTAPPPPPGNTTLLLQNGLNGYNGNVDSYVASGKPTINYGNATALYADGADGTNGRLIGVISWDLSAIPSSATVDSGTLTFNVFNGSNGSYNVYALNKSWNEGTVTWNSLNPTANLGALVGTLPAGGTGAKQIQLNAAGLALLQSWVVGTAPNNGFAIIDANTSDGIDLRSSEYGTSGSRPKLTVTYH